MTVILAFSSDFRQEGNKHIFQKLNYFFFVFVCDIFYCLSKMDIVYML